MRVRVRACVICVCVCAFVVCVSWSWYVYRDPDRGRGRVRGRGRGRGFKASNWEGGVRTFAFAAGGVLPPSQRGTTLPGMIHICDFYKTFITMAGGDPTDK